MSKIPASVLSFEKKLVPSDGLMYGTTWEKRKNQETPLKLQEKSVRGTISNRLKKSEEGKIDAKIESANLQTVDNCALSFEQDTLKLNFTLKVLSGIETPSACNHAGFNQTYQAAVKTYIKEEGFKELAKRYATNLANGRFFWRNRLGCEKMEIEVKVLNHNNQQSWTFDALAINIHDFSQENKEIDSLAQQIAQVLSGESEFLLLEINAYALIGKAQDVYPSEEMVLDKNNSKEKKSKILYHLNDIAAMHSQKLGNAIRTIDTWYADYATRQQPISIDPYGAVTSLGCAFRQPKKHQDFFSLFDQFAQGKALDSTDKTHFVMAVLVRGGVFGEKQ